MQRNVSKGAPDWVRTVAVWSFGAHREVHQVLCDDRRTLLWLANQRAVEFHVPFFRAGRDRADRAGARPRPAGGRRLRRGRAGGRAGAPGAGRRRAGRGGEDQRLEGRARRRPGARLGPEDVAAATRALAARAERLDPELATTAYIKEDRHGRVFLDSTRSGRRRSSPPTARGSGRAAGVGAGGWDDLADVRPGDVTVTTAAERLGDGDPWAAALPEPQELPADLVAEGHTIPVARVAAMHEGSAEAEVAAQLGDVAGGLDVVGGLLDAALGVDDEGRADHADDLLAVELLRPVRAVGLQHLLVRVGDQRDAEVLLLPEAQQLLRLVGGDADDVQPGLGEVARPRR
jgi:bifunctional non-homologous end joining protein LigD